MSQSFLWKSYNHLENITDTSVDRIVNRSLIEMILITVFASICDTDSTAEGERYGRTEIDWLRKLIKLDHGVHSHDTFGRVFSKLDRIEFYAALQSWVADIAESLKGETIEFD